MSCRCGMQFCYKCGGIYQQCECVLGSRPNVVNQPQIINDPQNPINLRNQPSFFNNFFPRIANYFSSQPQNINSNNLFGLNRGNVRKN